MSPVIDPLTALICLMFLGVLVTVFNVLTLFVIMKSARKKDDISITLVWLLCANIFIGLLPFPIYGLKKYEFNGVNTASRVCDAWRYTYFTGAHLAMVSLLIMTFDKIIHLRYPLRYIQLVTPLRLNLSLGISWLFFILFDAIPFFPIPEKDEDGCHYVVKKDWAVAMNVLTMVLPLPIIVTSYLYIVIVACKQAVRIRKQSNIQQRKLSTIENVRVAIETKATKKVTYILTAYLLCWLPSTFYYLLVWICPQCYPDDYEPHKTYIRFFFKLLVMCHALITPLLFCWQNGMFRTNFTKIFKKFRREKYTSDISTVTRTESSNF